MDKHSFSIVSKNELPWQFTVNSLCKYIITTMKGTRIRLNSEYLFGAHPSRPQYGKEFPF